MHSLHQWLCTEVSRCFSQSSEAQFTFIPTLLVRAANKKKKDKVLFQSWLLRYVTTLVSVVTSLRHSLYRRGAISNSTFSADSLYPNVSKHSYPTVQQIQLYSLPCSFLLYKYIFWLEENALRSGSCTSMALKLSS